MAGALGRTEEDSLIPRRPALWWKETGYSAKGETHNQPQLEQPWAEEKFTATVLVRDSWAIAQCISWSKPLNMTTGARLQSSSGGTICHLSHSHHFSGFSHDDKGFFFYYIKPTFTRVARFGYLSNVTVAMSRRTTSTWLRTSAR